MYPPVGKIFAYTFCKKYKHPRTFDTSVKSSCVLCEAERLKAFKKKGDLKISYCLIFIFPPRQIHFFFCEVFWLIKI